MANNREVMELLVFYKTHKVEDYVNISTFSEGYKILSLGYRVKLQHNRVNKQVCLHCCDVIFLLLLLTTGFLSVEIIAHYGFVPYTCYNSAHCGIVCESVTLQATFQSYDRLVPNKHNFSRQTNILS